ncbi:Nucleoside 5-triphosphatase RdgB dHAPTP, dITP, XTP-specific [Moraxella catarrhalis]|nr:Nucleoside 5-triphosphatase RdgB dHAPTP, dITP, XTP-specific [Moraxella catarrhalis]
MPLIAIGKWHGEILNEPVGEHGFGYDPLFYIPKLKKSSAQLDRAAKNAISHRASALQDLLCQLKETWLA